MRRFIFFLSALLIIGCQNPTKETKSESTEQEVEVVGLDEPLVVNFDTLAINLCAPLFDRFSNVRREFERMNNRYIEFDAFVYNVYRTYFEVWTKNRHRLYLKADKDVLVKLDAKKYKFRGVFSFTELKESYCDFDFIEIYDVVIVEELTDDK